MARLGGGGGDDKMKYKIKKLLKKTYNLYEEFVFFGVSGCVWPNYFQGKLPKWEQGLYKHPTNLTNCYILVLLVSYVPIFLDMGIGVF